MNAVTTPSRCIGGSVQVFGSFQSMAYLNGIVELKTKTLLPHDLQKLLTQMANAEFVPDGAIAGQGAGTKRALSGSGGCIE